MDVHWTGGLDRTVGQAWSVMGGMSNGCPMDVHWTGRTILSGQRILMANLDMSVFSVQCAVCIQKCTIGFKVLT